MRFTRVVTSIEVPEAGHTKLTVIEASLYGEYPETWCSECGALWEEVHETTSN